MERRSQKEGQFCLVLVGAGPGTEGFLLPAAREWMERAETVLAAKRLFPLVGRKDALAIGKVEDTLRVIEERLLLGDVAVVVSGDPLMYSLMRTILNSERGKEWKMEVIPGIGALQMMGAVFGETMEESRIVSVHGRVVQPGTIAMTVQETEKVFFYCSKEQSPAWICQALLEYGMNQVLVMVGSNLSYQGQQLWKGTPAELAGREFPDLCMVLVKNRCYHKVNLPAFLEDGAFFRGKTPMTKEEIRLLAIQKMRLTADAVVWDIGAGTGSVSVECARQCPYGQIHAVEYQEEALELLWRNQDRFGCGNLIIHRGRALSLLEELPEPQVVFIGGSGGELAAIVQYLENLPQQVRVVLTSVTLETMAMAERLLFGRKNFGCMQVSISRSRALHAQMHLMEGSNPVMIFYADI